MNTLGQCKPKRKVLSLRCEPNERYNQPQFVTKANAAFMVWREGGPAPNRIYAASERDLAVNHAKELCEQTGQRFHVMRSYRAFDPITE